MFKILFPAYRSSVMLSCWSKDPLERPSFADIVWQLEKLFEFPDIAQEVSFIQLIKLLV